MQAVPVCHSTGLKTYFAGLLEIDQNQQVSSLKSYEKITLPDLNAFGLPRRFGFMEPDLCVHFFNFKTRFRKSYDTDNLNNFRFTLAFWFQISLFNP